MRTYEYIPVEQEPEQEPLPARSYPSPKRSAINLLVASYIFALFMLIAHQVVSATYLATFFAVIAFCLHLCGFICCVWIDEYQ